MAVLCYAATCYLWTDLLVLHMPQRSGRPWLVAEEGAGDLQGGATVSLEAEEVHLAEVCNADASSQEGL